MMSTCIYIPRHIISFFSLSFFFSFSFLFIFLFCTGGVLVKAAGRAPPVPLSKVFSILFLPFSYFSDTRVLFIAAFGFFFGGGGEVFLFTKPEGHSHSVLFSFLYHLGDSNIIVTTFTSF